MGFLQKLFGRPAAEQAAPPVSGGVTAESGVRVTAGFAGRVTDQPGPMAVAHEGEATEAEWVEFRQRFCFQPEKYLLAFLRAEGVTRLEEWLHWSNPDPFPKAFIRLALETMRRGENFWEQPGVVLFWSQPGEPRQENQDALSVLAQVLEQPIKVYYHPPGQKEFSTLVFEP